MLIWHKIEITVKIGHFDALEHQNNYLDRKYEFRNN